MLKKVPLRIRLTILSVLLLTACCIGLTIFLNLSAGRMVDTIEATPILNAYQIDGRSIAPAVDSTPMLPLVAPEVSEAARSDYRQQSIIYTLLIAAAGGILTYIICGRSLEPLTELSRQMKNRTVHNLSEDLKVPESHDEIAELTRSFNEMTHSLDESFAMQKRFSQSAAHELRTPLTVLKTKVEVFHKKKFHTPDEYERLLDMVSTHTNRLSSLVKELLDLTSIDAVECQDRIDLKVLTEGVFGELSSLAAEKHISLTVRGSAAVIRGSESLLRIAFYNLVENAVKYNRENGSVSVTLSKEKEQILINIEDTGIGIPGDMQTLVFEPFFRVDKSRSRSLGGAGLGLATAKAVIERHHGRICVSDSRKGGSLFTISLLVPV